jgi:DNA-directed RNA polymerase specialized sigma24 family protein
MDGQKALFSEMHLSAAEPAWDEVVARIRSGDASGLEELYRVFANGIRFYLYRQFGSQDLDDKLHDIFLIVALAIRAGELREPQRLMGFVRTILRRQVACYIESAVCARRKETKLDKGFPIRDHRPDPERRAIERQNVELAMRVLGSVRKRDREVLIRFYLKEQTPIEICRDMHLSVTQFRLIKTRAKNRFGQLGRNRMRLSAAEN